MGPTMKNALLWVMVMVVVTASGLVIADKIGDVVEARRGKAAPGGSGAPGPAAADRDVARRLERVERVLESVRLMLEIPPTDDPAEDGAASREGEETTMPPPQAGLGERLQWVESQMLDLKRQTNRDLVQIYTRLRRRLDELEAKLLQEGAPDTRATVADLAKLGVTLKPDEGLVSMEAAFAQPTRVLEFVAVGAGGNVHESLLVVNAKPSALKRALALMGVVEAPDPPFDVERIPKDSTVFVYVTWPGRAKPVRVEKLLRNLATGKLLAPTPFVFTASRPFIDSFTWEEHLAADIHRHTIGLTWNYAGEAVLACPAEEAHSEHVWTPEVDALPDVPSPATILVTKAPRAEWD
jgi:hypothetical protein